MKNITITLDDETVTWARTYAAQQKKSLSKFLGELLNDTMHESCTYDDAASRYLSKSPTVLNLEIASHPARNELHER